MFCNSSTLLDMLVVAVLYTFLRLEIPLFRDSLELGDIHEEAEAMLDFFSVLRRVVPVLVMLLIEAMEK